MIDDTESSENTASADDEAEEKRKRAWYDAYFERIDAYEAANPTLTLLRCPCCGYATLTKRYDVEICGLCFWEDNCQDDPDADEIQDTLNNDSSGHSYSLTEARQNFRERLIMYRPIVDAEPHEINSDEEYAVKQEIVRLFEAIAAASEQDVSSLTTAVRKKLGELDKLVAYRCD